VELPLAYRFDPSADDDGVTISVPLVVVAQIDPGELDWTIPGLLQEKIAALLHELPRHLRRDLGPVPDLARRLAERLVPFQGPMIPALARALADESCVEVPEDAFRPDAVPPYLRFTCRLMGDDGKAIAQGRDVASLWSEHGARARAAWTEGGAGSQWERKGLKAWDFGDLPSVVTRRVSGMTVRAHPSLVDRGATVDLVLLASAAAAEAATRAGTRRLLANVLSGRLSAFSPRVPGPFPLPSGEPPSRAQQEAFRARAMLRVVEHAFDLDGGAALPRSKREFDALVARGAPRIESSFRVVAELVQGVCRELESTLRALRSASKHPTAKGAIAEIRAQLERLFPEDLIAWIPFERLQHVPRYVRAAQARLERAIADPRKDAEKLSRIQPAWTAFLAKESTARDRAAALALRWSFEELRVAVFAPELKTAIAVSPATLSAEVASLR
jgi:ATP-dependent helicase HrpA